MYEDFGFVAISILFGVGIYVWLRRGVGVRNRRAGLVATLSAGALYGLLKLLFGGPAEPDNPPVIVKDINQIYDPTRAPKKGSNPRGFVNAADRAYFTAIAGKDKTGGGQSPPVTHRIYHYLESGSTVSVAELGWENPEQRKTDFLTLHAGNLFFAADKPGSSQVWRLKAGAFLEAKPILGSQTIARVRAMLSTESLLFILGDDGTGMLGVWSPVTVGGDLTYELTAAGSAKVAGNSSVQCADCGYGSPGGFLAFAHASPDGKHRLQIFKSGLSSADYGHVGHLAAVGAKLYFTAGALETALKLRTHDGTTVASVTDPETGAAITAKGPLLAAASNLFFVRAPSGKDELWLIDAGVPTKVDTGDVDQGPVSIQAMTVLAGDQVWFAARDGAGKTFLWKVSSDGKTAAAQVELNGVGEVLELVPFEGRLAMSVAGAADLAPFWHYKPGGVPVGVAPEGWLSGTKIGPLHAFKDRILMPVDSLDKGVEPFHFPY